MVRHLLGPFDCAGGREQPDDLTPEDAELRTWGLGVDVFGPVKAATDRIIEVLAVMVVLVVDVGPDVFSLRVRWSRSIEVDVDAAIIGLDVFADRIADALAGTRGEFFSLAAGCGAGRLGERVGEFGQESCCLDGGAGEEGRDTNTDEGAVEVEWRDDKLRILLDPDDEAVEGDFWEKG